MCREAASSSQKLRLVDFPVIRNRDTRHAGQQSQRTFSPFHGSAAEQSIARMALAFIESGAGNRWPTGEACSLPIHIWRLNAWPSKDCVLLK